MFFSTITPDAAEEKKEDDETLSAADVVNPWEEAITKEVDPLEKVDGETVCEKKDEAKTLKTIQQLLKEGKKGAAAQELLSFLTNPKQISEPEKLYEHLHSLFPFLIIYPSLLRPLQNLIDNSLHSSSQQLVLAVDLAERELLLLNIKRDPDRFEECLKKALNAYDDAITKQEIAKLQDEWAQLKLRGEGDPLRRHYFLAMHYYGKALLITKQCGESPQKIHQKLSHLLFQFMCECLFNGSPKEFLLTDPVEAKKALEQLKKVETFCLQKDECENFYRTLERNLLPVSSESLNDQHRSLLGAIQATLEKLPSWQPSSWLLSENYHNAVECFRRQFSPFEEDIRCFQKRVTSGFKNLFSVFLKDIFAVLGPPPCDYDIRAMGSVAREELCPFSDIELVVLVDSRVGIAYFNNLLEILNLQIHTLAEQPPNGTVEATTLRFTCLKVRVGGLHLDGFPDVFIGTPEELANHQKLKEPLPEKFYDRENAIAHELGPQSLRNMSRKSTSLSSSSGEGLLKRYQQAAMQFLLMPLEGGGRLYQQYALFNLHVRLKGYKQLWSSPFHKKTTIDLKKSFTELLNHFLTDLVFYFGLNEADQVNALDISDALARKAVFSENTLHLIQKLLKDLYKIRVRAHIKYACQQDEFVLHQPKIGENFLPQSEQVILESAYWLLLKPLYGRLEYFFEKQKPLDELFDRLDLVDVAFKEFLADLARSATSPSLSRLSHLVQHAALKNLSSYYEALSYTIHQEPFRECFLEELKSHRPEFTDVALLEEIPNRAGVRISAKKKAAEFQAALGALTTLIPEFDHGFYVNMVSPSLGSRFLKSTAIQQILDENGLIRICYKSAHRVASAKQNQHQLHFKQKPTHPLMEEAVHDLTNRIAGQLTAVTELVRFEVITGNGSPLIYPVLVSLTIEGETLLAAEQRLEQVKWTTQAWDRWSWLLISAILTRPGDGHFENYIFTKENALYGIDNDLSFVHAVIEEGLLKQKVVRFCCALFCVFEKLPLSEKVLQQFIRLEMDIILMEWIEHVIRKEREYTKLFHEKEQKKLYDEDPDNRFKAGILFAKGAMSTLSLQCFKLKKYFSEELAAHRPITPLNLLEQLVSLQQFHQDFAVGAYVHQRYHAVVQSGRSLDQKLKQIRLLPAAKMSTRQSDRATFGKTPLFEERKEYGGEEAKRELIHSLLLHQSKFFIEKRADGEVAVHTDFQQYDTDYERQQQLFAMVEHAIGLEPKKPNRLSLSYCQILRTKNLLPLLHRGITALDLRHCSQLTEEDLVHIQEQCPRLKELYLAEHPKIKQIVHRKVLTSEPLKFAELSILNISQCAHLVAIDIETPLLQHLILDMQQSSASLANNIKVTAPLYPTFNLSGIAVGFMQSILLRAWIKLITAAWKQAKAGRELSLGGNAELVCHCAGLELKPLIRAAKTGFFDNPFDYTTAENTQMKFFRKVLGPSYPWKIIRGGVDAANLHLDADVRVDRTLSKEFFRDRKPLKTLQIPSSPLGMYLDTYNDGTLIAFSHETETYLVPGRTHVTMANMHPQRQTSYTEKKRHISKVKLWNIFTGTNLASLIEAEERPLSYFETLSDGLFAIVLDNSSVEFGDALTGQRAAMKSKQIALKEGERVTHITSIENRVLVGGSAGSLVFLDHRSDFYIAEEHQGLSSLISSKMNFITGASDGTIKFWSGLTKNCLKTLTTHLPIKMLRILRNGSLVCGDKFGSIVIINSSTGEQLSTLKGHTGAITEVLEHPNGALISSSEDNTIRLWSPVGSSYECLRVLHRHDAPIMMLKLLKNGMFVSASLMGYLREDIVEVKLWEM